MNDPALVDRWDSFLAQIRQRFTESLTQAEAAVLSGLETNGYDVYASLRAQTAMSRQIEESLVRKIDVTWREQVRPAMECDGDYWVHQIHKGPTLELELQRDLHLWNIATSGKLAERYYAYALTLMRREFRCSQCQAPLTLPPCMFQAGYVTCSFCNTVNTFVPETKHAVLRNFIDKIAAYHALDAYRPVAELQYAAPSRSEDPGASQAYESAVRAYCDAFCRARIAILPEKEATYKADLALELSRLLPSSPSV